MRRTLLSVLLFGLALAGFGGAARLSVGATAAASPLIGQGYPVGPIPTTAALVTSVPAPTTSVAPAASTSAAAATMNVSIANFAFSPASISIHVGDTITWMNNDSTTHTTTSDTGVWDSGPLQPGASFSHTFSSAGTFTYHCMIHPFMMGTVVVQPAAASVPTTSPAPSQAAGVQVNYAAGWNLVSGPAGTTVSQANGPLYTFRPGDMSYEVVASGTPLLAGAGYWAFFDAPVTETLPASGSQPVSLQLPADQFVLIGNPGLTPMMVSGADAVFSYDPLKGYQATTVLQPGQGAWAFSAGGGMLTMSAAAGAH